METKFFLAYFLTSFSHIGVYTKDTKANRHGTISNKTFINVEEEQTSLLQDGNWASGKVGKIQLCGSDLV